MKLPLYFCLILIVSAVSFAEEGVEPTGPIQMNEFSAGTTLEALQSIGSDSITSDLLDRYSAVEALPETTASSYTPGYVQESYRVQREQLVLNAFDPFAEVKAFHSSSNQWLTQIKSEKLYQPLESTLPPYGNFQNLKELMSEKFVVK